MKVVWAILFYLLLIILAILLGMILYRSFNYKIPTTVYPFTTAEAKQPTPTLTPTITPNPTIIPNATPTETPTSTPIPTETPTPTAAPKNVSCVDLQAFYNKYCN